MPGCGSSEWHQYPRSSQLIMKANQGNLQKDEVLSQAPTHRVLMVEDDPSYRTLVKRILMLQKAPKFDFIGVGSLKECIEHLQRDNFDIILLDLSLPDSSGILTVRKVLEVCSGTPLVILSGRDDSESGVLAVALGAQDYLVKHQVSNDALVRCIRYAIERKKFEESTIRLSAIRDFMSTLAHDLQVPMIGASNVFDALIKGQLGPLPNDFASVISSLRENNLSQLKLVQKLIELYKYEIDSANLVLRPIDLKSLLLQTSLKAFENCLERLVTIFPEECPTVLGDFDSISWLFANLLDNAIKFGDADTAVEIKVVQVGEKLEIHVHNSGKPIPAELREHLFAGFWQGVPGSVYVARTGMGLYLCQRIVSNHRGRLSCQSSDSGTTMTVRLPIFSDAQD